MNFKTRLLNSIFVFLCFFGIYLISTYQINSIEETIKFGKLEKVIYLGSVYVTEGNRNEELEYKGKKYKTFIVDDISAIEGQEIDLFVLEKNGEVSFASPNGIPLLYKSISYIFLSLAIFTFTLGVFWKGE